MQSDSNPVWTDVAIVGSGAAGLASAIFAARRTAGLAITILDGSEELGAKILLSGGGRCNITNRLVKASDYCGGNPNLIKRILAAFPADQASTFFREIGVNLKEEENGKIFPATDKARTVLDALLRETARRGVTIRPAHRVTLVERHDDGFHIETTDKTLFARQVVLATGGQSLPNSGSDGAGFDLARRLGHTLVPMTPALVPLMLAGEFHAPFPGIPQDVELTVQSADAKTVRTNGAMLWTHLGVSGPAVLDASRHWHRAKLEGREVRITVNFLPGEDFATTERRLLDHAAAKPRALVRSIVSSMLPRRVADAFMRELGIEAAVTLAQLRKDHRRKLVHSLTAWPLPISDSRGYDHSEVTAGGIPLSEIDCSSMASRKCPGLFLVGEILDVDGRIGGFNFQWAWSSAFVAGIGIERAAAGK